MPSPGPTASAGVPSEEAFFRSALKLALGRREANEVAPKQESLPDDPVTRFRHIIKEAEQTVSQPPLGIYKKER